MKFLAVLTILSTLSATAFAQATGPVDPAKVDPCIANCSLKAGQTVGCDPTNQQCICVDKKAAFQAAAIPCLMDNKCDLGLAQSTSDQVCKYGFIGAASSSAPPATTAPEPTTGAPPASTTGAPPASTTGAPPASTTGAPPVTGGPAPTCKPKARRRAHVRAQL
ncbi:uncharacterized protein LOC62_02G001816 [Vanrija pseudolonga]|uniref:Extracellular membrane protein CFEM domain-containing protein n=1 Tax=Vanrija pseudolonga TaxID=143232 RepID=A0AAF0Y1H7_9TREE|nr:hypothetical protein LOC62_02G001816 [Vanrija pseudolonga]